MGLLAWGACVDFKAGFQRVIQRAVIHVQSQTMRVRQRQRVEQEARRAPVKMVFPLVFCLMPSLFIFILGPILVTVIEFISD